MNGIKRFVVSASYLACVSILLRAVSVSFNAYVSTKVGAEGMGLFSLVMSVYSFAVTLACSGINLASTRLTAKILSSANAENIRSESRKLMRSCAAYSLFFGTAAGAALFFGSGIIGEKLLCDARTVPSLKALALSLPAISLSTALCGYFTGARRVSRNAAVMIAEQANKILLITAMLVLFAPRGLQWACFAVVAGGSVSEGFSLAFSYLFYRADMRRLKRGRNIFSANVKNGLEEVGTALEICVIVHGAHPEGKALGELPDTDTEGLLGSDPLSYAVDLLCQCEMAFIPHVFPLKDFGVTHQDTDKGCEEAIGHLFSRLAGLNVIVQLRVPFLCTVAVDTLAERLCHAVLTEAAGSFAVQHGNQTALSLEIPEDTCNVMILADVFHTGSPPVRVIRIVVAGNLSAAAHVVYLENMYPSGNP